MRFLTLILLSLLAVTASAEELFRQDVATVFDTDDVAHKWSKILPGPVALGGKKVLKFDGKSWQPVERQEMKTESAPVGPEGERVYANARKGSRVYAGCEGGLYLFDKGWHKLFPADERYSWAPRNVKVVIFDSKGRLWFAAKEGVGYLDRKKWRLFTGKEGLPFNRFTCGAAGPDGEVWFGTEHGAIRSDGEQFFYRNDRRWLPNNHVNDIYVDDSGSAWIATNRGISRIEPKRISLEQKAEYFIEQVERRHNRMGFIADCRLEKRFDVESWMPKISDNDGLYTAMYGAAMAFEFAATGNPRARELAVRSFQACKWLVDITHEPGFPARVIIPVDWPEPVNEQYGPEYNERKRKGDPFWKLITPRFVTSRDGKYLWKCDTSSDELAGHYFFYGIYYDLVAKTEEEKKAVRRVVADITDHLIRHDFTLVDHDGKPTRWANFSPDFFNSVYGWEQRGLNSMMMLSFLNVAEHITGDKKYEKTARMLREKHQYHINAMQAKMYFPPDFVVPWDNNLSLMSFYGLIKYEKDPELLLMYRFSLEHAWLHISKQKSAFWNGLYGACAQHFDRVVETGVYDSGEILPEAGHYARTTARQLYRTDYKKEDILETLERIPLDLISYEMDNTHRLDVVFDPTPGQAPTVGWHASGTALPIDERGHVRLDRDGFALYANEDDGHAEHEGTFFLLPYYLAKFHKLID